MTTTEKQLFIPLVDAGRATERIGMALAPAIGGSIALAVGALVFFVLSRKADPNETHAIRLFGTIFALFGLLFIRVGVSSAFASMQARRRSRNSDPWLRDYPWNPRGAKESPASILSSIIWTAIFVAMIVPFNTIWRTPWTFFWIVVGILDLFAAAAVWGVLTRVLQAVRTGTSALEWGQFPSHVGSRFAATFRSSRRIAATAPFTVTLRCVNQRWVNRGDSSTKNSYEVYSEAVEVRPHDDPRGGTVLHLDFAVPPGAQGTHLAQLNPVFWQLVVTAPTAGPDFSATFLVPIYAPGGPPRETASEERVVVTTRWVRGRGVVTVDDANTSRFPLYFGVAVFGLVGLGLVWFATSTAIDTIRFLNAAETVEGTVLREETSWSRSSDGKQSKSVAAVIGYRVGGREYTVSQQITSGSSTYAVGEHVRVLYRPSRPDEARIDATLELFFLPILLGFMGLMCVGASGAIWGVFIKR